MNKPHSFDSFLSGSNADYLDEMYLQYKSDPSSIDPSLKDHFQYLELYSNKYATISTEVGEGGKQAAVSRLIGAYRSYGHKIAQFDPINQMEREAAPELELSYLGLDESDLSSTFNAGTLAGGEQQTLKDIIETLKAVYCGPLGVEYKHITSTEEIEWFIPRIEAFKSGAQLDKQKKVDLLKKVTASEGIEKYLHTRYVGQKRFSLEGGESLIPMVHEMVQRAGTKGTKEIVIGMAHRGRLNVLINILGKKPSSLFSEFEGDIDTSQFSDGDVKYHMGFSSDIKTPGGPTHLSLAFNPSHLEIVSPVVNGSVKARQMRRNDYEGDTVLPISIHGDAAFAGQGVVMETFNMAACKGYKVGGTVHIVVNNQIGFTTSVASESRSTAYCTDVAKMINAPIFHVNGDDPEAVVFATQVALDYRYKFKKDVVIDLVCYRRHGHNEADEPAVTQPIMYKNIRAKDTSRRIYAQKLIDEGTITEADEKKFIADYRSSLEVGEVVTEDFIEDYQGDHTIDWNRYFGGKWDDYTNTSISKRMLTALGKKLLELPEEFEPHARIKAVLASREKMINGDQELDWGMAESLAYASLIDQGHGIRISGQDSERGTFFHRHAVVYNTKKREGYTPLRHINEYQPNLCVINSVLSEEAVLAFEYGYSTADPERMVIWEAQFGDFANGAQVVIDQFISSGEAKWGRLCGLTMFLPHGYEGQGPEHSSARIERYLQLCADYNIQVCAPTTPAQMFHMIRRQMLRPYRKPLIVMTPKSLLRHKLSVSNIKDLTDGEFQPVIGEIDKITNSKVNRIVICSGKVYFDLVEHRRENKLNETAVVRIEQLYPFSRTDLNKELKKYKNANEIVWCQEEPMNQGPWYQIQHQLRQTISSKQTLAYTGRRASASPAAGYLKVHNAQQKAIVEASFAPLKDDNDYQVL
jgi:2-oxoglutarate dehydrogenase E1 component